MSFLRRNIHSKEDKRIKKRVVNFSQKAISSWKRSAVKDYESPSQKSYGNFPRHKRYNEGGGTRLNSRLDSSTLGFSWHQDSSNHAKFPSDFSKVPPFWDVPGRLPLQTLYWIGIAGVAVIAGAKIEFKVKAARTTKKNLSDSTTLLIKISWSQACDRWRHLQDSE